MRARSIYLLLLLLLPRLAAAQVTYNPTRIEFESPDHDTNVSSYIVEYWLENVDPTTGAPYTSSTLAKSALTVTGGIYSAFLTSLSPLPAIQVGTNYKATVIAVGVDTSQRSARSNASNSFARALVPANPRAVSVR